MTARKRKQPEKKKKAAPRRSLLASGGLMAGGVAVRAVRATGGLAARHPTGFGGAAAFCVVFSFVAANALWYQHGNHPSPFLRTRLPAAETPLTAPGDALAARKVTTFVIQREDEVDTPSTSSIGTPATPDPQGEATDQANASEPAAPTVATRPTGSTLVADIQKQLARRGLYDGDIDGRTGPKTSAAILRFEKQAGRPQTGAANDTLLASLQTGSITDGGAEKSATAAKPEQRPYQSAKANQGELDPVAAAIRNADINPDYIPKADIPASSEMVMNIQKGLINLAYGDITIDGVANAATRSAIKHFEKHYRLPTTGEPSAAVLKKMKEIGAL